MLQVNFQNVVASDTLINTIILTDGAYSEQSVVYMEKALAPRKHDLVWVTIADPNGGYMLRRWMYVEQVLYTDYSDPILRTASGNPVLDSEGRTLTNSLRDKPGFVKIILREHKHGLMLSKATDYYNIPNLLRYATPNNANLYEEYDLNRMLWPDIENFISHYSIKLNAPESLRPPLVPINLLWRGLLLADCLDDLLNNFACRVVEQVLVVPDEVFFEDADFRNIEFMEDLEILTNLNWKKRRFVDLPPSIKYDTLMYPESSTEERILEQDSVQLYIGTLNNRDFQDAGGSDQVLNPVFSPFYCDKALVGADYTELRQYVRETHINKHLYYGFTTKRLPETFLQDYDWSKIQYVFGDTYDIVVEHHPREQHGLLMNTPITRSETYVGRITSMTQYGVTLTDVRNLTAPNKNVYLRDFVTIQVSGLDHTNIGKDLTFKVENNTLSLVSTSSLFSPFSDSVTVRPMFDGVDVMAVTHSIAGLDYECPDSAIAFGDDEIYDYQFDSVEINPEASSMIDSYVYPIILNPGTPWFFGEQTYYYWAKVRFRMKATLEEITEFLEDSPLFSPMGEAYVYASANYWVNNFSIIDTYLSFTPGPTRIQWVHTPMLSFPRFGAHSFLHSGGKQPYLAPDVSAEWFTGPADYTYPAGTNFPLTFPLPEREVTVVPNLIPFYGKVGFNYNALYEELTLRYIRNHLETFPATITLGLA
jgi:hypothetical protein